MEQILRNAAYRWGGFVASYFRRAVPANRTVIEGLQHHIPSSVIWIGWHRVNLLGLVGWRHLDRSRQCHSFVPNGLVGDVARGWVEGAGSVAAPLPPDLEGNPRAAMKQLLQALNQGGDVIVAVDGPHGPANIVRPGAPWLARMSGCPLVPVGMAAVPAFSLPRWDRLRIPLPGSRLAISFGEPLQIGRRAELDSGLLDDIARRLNNSMKRADELLKSAPMITST